jgi:hypothetical protein
VRRVVVGIGQLLLEWGDILLHDVDENGHMTDLVYLCADFTKYLERIAVRTALLAQLRMHVCRNTSSHTHTHTTLHAHTHVYTHLLMPPVCVCVWCGLYLQPGFAHPFLDVRTCVYGYVSGAVTRLHPHLHTADVEGYNSAFNPAFPALIQVCTTLHRGLYCTQPRAHTHTHTLTM